MCYEYQHKIKSDLKFFDESGTISNVYKLDEKLVELDEVYRKAEAFDEIKDYLSRPSPIDEDRDEVQKIIDEYDKEDSQ